MSSQQESTAVAVARAHVGAWGVHDYEVARGALAPEVHLIVTSLDRNTPQDVKTGAEEYMEGLVAFGQVLLPGTTRVISASGHDARALLQVSSRVKFGPDAPEMTLDAARMYRVDESGKIVDERVIFYVSPE